MDGLQLTKIDCDNGKDDLMGVGVGERRTKTLHLSVETRGSTNLHTQRLIRYQP